MGVLRSPCARIPLPTSQPYPFSPGGFLWDPRDVGHHSPWAGMLSVCLVSPAPATVLAQVVFRASCLCRAGTRWRTPHGLGQDGGAGVGGLVG